MASKPASALGPSASKQILSLKARSHRSVLMYMRMTSTVRGKMASKPASALGPSASKQVLSLKARSHRSVLMYVRMTSTVRGKNGE